MVIHATLCHIIKNEKLLLQKKSKGLFGESKWNGIGGKLKIDETPEDCIRREISEEANLKILNLKRHGVLNFYFGGKDELDWVVFVFSANDFEEEPFSSKEGILKWFSFEDIPYDKMWQDDRHWLPLLLAGKCFQGKFYFSEDDKKLIDFDLKELK